MNAPPHAAQTPAERAPALLFCRATVADGSIDETARTVRFIASTEDIDGHGTIVRQNWDLKRFTPRGVVLYAHCADELPIGTATVSVVDGKLMADVKFSTKELNDKAEQVWLNVKEGVLRGISPGFLPHTITFERHDDREVMVLDDNELIELSVTPCPSNAGALAQIRSLHTPPPAPETPPIPSDGPAVTEHQPIPKEAPMADDNKNDKPDPMNTMTVARALGLPAGATEQDVLNAILQLRELDVTVSTITDAKNRSEAIGMLRGMQEATRKLAIANKELSALRTERDAQSFEVLVQAGRLDCKLSVAEEQNERELFAKALEENRAAAYVDEFGGRLKVKAPDVRFAATRKQPAAAAGAGTPLLWNGKAYRDLKPAQRARLANEDEALYRAMRDDHEAAGAAA